MIGSGTQRSPNGTEAYSDGNHNSHALLGDVNGGAATVGTMSLPLTPLVTDIQWPRWLKMGPAPKNVTYKALGASRGIWAASGSPPGVPTVPSWAMVRCYSSSHPPILYTVCVGFYSFSHIKHTNFKKFGHSLRDLDLKRSLDLPRQFARPPARMLVRSGGGGS